jgi:hypothetical protein
MEPIGPWLIWWFWQYTQRILQWAKKIVPAPPFPEIGGSSPKWGTIEAIDISAPVKQ